jgi:uncharacterized membrane protein
MTLSYDAYASEIISFYNLKPMSGEHHGPCPHCGGEDRFRLQNYKGELRHHCRKACQLGARTDAMRRDGLIPPYGSGEEVPYHDQKGIPLIGAELRGPDVIITLYDILTDTEAGAQTITPSGRKFYSKGMRKAGVGAFIGEPTDRIYVTEGWADAVVIHQVTGRQVLFALDASSMPNAVAALRQRYSHSEIIVVADHDDDGLKAAQATGAPYCRPSQPGMDAWDVWNAGGDEAVVTMLGQLISGRTLEHPDPLADFNIVSGDKLTGMTFEPIEFLVPGVLPTPALALLAGPPKAGKSWLAWRWALEVAVQGSGVVYVATEDNRRRIQSRLAALNSSMPANLRLLAAHNSGKPIPRGVDAIEFIRSVKAGYQDTALIVIDIAQAVMEVTARDKGYGGASAEWGALQRLAHELKVAILLVHHTKKTTGLDLSSPLESVLGSTAIAATAETLMIMQPIAGSRDVKLHITGKDVDTLDLVFPWQNPGFGDPVDAGEASLGEAQKAVLDYIRGNQGCAQRTIATDLKKDPGQVSKIIMRLTAAGMVSRNETNGLFPV